jgi:hypothetical protein
MVACAAQQPAPHLLRDCCALQLAELGGARLLLHLQHAALGGLRLRRQRWRCSAQRAALWRVAACAGRRLARPAPGRRIPAGAGAAAG